MATITCPVCRHTDRREIDLRLAQGDSAPSIAEFFGVEIRSIRKHHAEHVNILPTQLGSSPSKALLDLERVEQDAWSVVLMASGIRSSGEDGDDDGWLIKPNPVLKLSALKEVRETKMAQIRAAKELAMLRHDMVPRDRVTALINVIQQALADFPEAHAAVQRKMEEMPI